MATLGLLALGLREVWIRSRGSRARPPRELARRTSRVGERRAGYSGAMEIRRSRVLLAGVSVAALVLCIGSVSARPETSPGKFVPKLDRTAGVDAAIARRIKPTALTKDQAVELQKRATPEAAVPAFKIRRLELGEKVQLLGASGPEALPGPLRYDARTNYHDEQNYMEIQAYNGGSLGVRSGRNYLHFSGTVEALASQYTRPSAVIRFRSPANTRTLIECAVDSSNPTNFYATDWVNQYSLHSSDKATLLYMRGASAVAEDVYVSISADVPGWYLDGCEVTQVAG